MKFLNLLIFLFLFYNFGDSSSSSCKELRIFIYPSYGISRTCNWKASELKCDGNDTALYIGDTKYLVKDMSVENKTLRLVDPYLEVGGCRLPNQTLSLDHYGDPNVLAWYNLIYFFSCTEEVEDNNLYKQIHCMDGPHSRVYAVYSDNAYLGSTPKSCRYLGRTVPGSEVNLRWHDTDGDEMMQMLTQGFVARWSTTNINIGGDNKMPSSLQYCWDSTKR
ncbi:hypothetical protein FCM35_KLT10347 [Carex littledalei]|uniref:Wall-associated receptor kinase galacturonan-binding domain-containing protein n=1 Tax=Carex littledalei TaxID=544730 RepID=A0A833QNV5_9POAL|nr:hypothetical protein FCM35_KLT10347 [Carex littledalei]